MAKHPKGNLSKAGQPKVTAPKKGGIKKALNKGHKNKSSAYTG